MLSVKLFHGEDKGGGAYRTSLNLAEWLREQGHVVELLTYRQGSLTRDERQIWFENNISREDLIILVQPEMFFACFRYFFNHPSAVFSSRHKFVYHMRNDLAELRKRFSLTKNIAHYFCLLIFAYIVRGHVVTNAFLEKLAFIPMDYLANIYHLSADETRVGKIDRFVFVNGASAQKRPDILLSKMATLCMKTGMSLHVYGPPIHGQGQFIVNQGYQSSIDYTQSALLCSSDYEGEPNVFLEAFEQRVPVIYIGTNERLKTIVHRFFGVVSENGNVDLEKLEGSKITGMNDIRRQSISQFGVWLNGINEEKKRVY
jgi:glycosyltransferase involved in cell wall biosynthesis